MSDLFESNPTFIKVFKIETQQQQFDSYPEYKIKPKLTINEFQFDSYPVYRIKTKTEYYVEIDSETKFTMTPELVYCFGKSYDNKITEPKIAVALKLTSE